MTFRANSMTFHIETERWAFASVRRLESEREEFARWFYANSDGLTAKEREGGENLIGRLDELIEQKKDEAATRFFADRSRPPSAGSQLRFFPSR